MKENAMSAAKDYTAVPGADVPVPVAGMKLEMIPATGDTVTLIPTSPPSRMDVLANIVSRLNGDVDKVERIMKLVTEAEAKDHERAFNAALRRCQTRMTAITVNAQNKQTGSKYADYYALDAVVRPIYTEEGFAVTFSTAEAGPEAIKVLGWLLHDDGHSRQYEITMPADGKGPKGQDVMSKTHATGAAMMYGKRYLLMDMFNLAIDKDDDGNGAGDGRQTEILFSLIQDASAKETGFNADAFCKFFGVDAVADLPRKDFQRACDMLKRKIGAQKAPEYLE